MKHIFIIAIVLVTLAVNPAFAAGEHRHDGQAGTLQLNAGKKWETDAALRKAMAEIRQTLAAKLEPIHDNRLTAKEYGKLAKKVDGAVADIIAQCKLPPAADAQLHLVVAELLAGAEQMANKTKTGKPRDGAVQVIGALNNYGKYFDDPGFKPIDH